MTERQVNPKVALFLKRLERLDPGSRARLKRGAGKPIAESRDALGLFYSLLPPGVPPSQEQAYFLVATLFPMADAGSSGDLGACLHRTRQTENAPGLDRRVEFLLDADEAQLPFRLRQAIRFLRSNRVRVDWQSLLQDLMYWNHPDRFVQRQWARSYFAGPSQSEPKGE